MQNECRSVENSIDSIHIKRGKRDRAYPKKDHNTINLRIACLFTQKFIAFRQATEMALKIHLGKIEFFTALLLIYIRYYLHM